MTINCALSGDMTSDLTPHSPYNTCYYSDFGLNNYDRDDDKSYLRFFNQPIEQIPGYKEGEFQILTHGCHVGLHWHSPVCVEVMVHACSGNNPYGSHVKVYYQNLYVIAEYEGGTTGSEFISSYCP